MLTKDQLGKKISVEATGVDKYKGTVKSAETAAVVENEVKEVKITGFSVKSSGAKDADTPAVGDTLTAELTPASAAENVTYQWYRGTTILAGETKATYTVVDADLGSALKVVVTPKTGAGFGTKAVTSELTKQVVKSIAKDAVSIAFPTAAPVVGEKYTATLTLKDPTNDKNTYSYQWFDGETALGQAAQISFDTTKHTATAEIASVPNTVKAGDKLTLKVTAASLQGEITADTAATSQKLGELKATADTGAIKAGITTLTASFGTNAKETATYQWYTVDKDGVSTLISGATAAKYEVPATDTDAIKSYKVVATGTGNYTGTVTASVEATFTTGKLIVESLNVQDKDAKVVGTKDADGNTIGIVTGSTYTAVPAIAKAADHFSYKWYVNDVEMGTEQSFTVPATAIGMPVVVKATLKDTKDADYEIKSNTLDSTAVEATTALTGITVKITDKASAADTAAKEVEATTSAYAHASVTPTAATASYQWYTDKVTEGNKIAAANTADLALANYTGHTLICVATGTNNYSGTATSTATAKVTKVLGEITVKQNDGNVGDLNVGDVLTVSAAGLTAGTDYTVALTVGGTAKTLTKKADNSGYTYTLTADDANKVVVASATPGTGVTAGANLKAVTINTWAAQPKIEFSGYANKKADGIKAITDALKALNETKDVADSGNYMYYVDYSNMSSTATYFWQVKAADGTVINTATIVNPSKTNVLVRADFQNAQQNIRAYQFTNAEMKAGNADGTYTIELYKGTSAQGTLLNTTTFTVAAKDVVVE